MAYVTYHIEKVARISRVVAVISLVEFIVALIVNIAIGVNNPRYLHELGKPIIAALVRRLSCSGNFSMGGWNSCSSGQVLGLYVHPRGSADRIPETDRNSISCGRVHRNRMAYSNDVFDRVLSERRSRHARSLPQVAKKYPAARIRADHDQRASSPRASAAGKKRCAAPAMITTSPQVRAGSFVGDEAMRMLKFCRNFGTGFAGFSRRQHLFHTKLRRVIFRLTFPLPARNINLSWEARVLFVSLRHFPFSSQFGDGFLRRHRRK